MKKLYAALVAVVLGIGGAATLGAIPAEAHVPSITATCQGVVLNASAYDGNKLNTWDVNIGGVEQTGTFGESFSQTFPVPQDGATTHVTAKIADADNTPAYTQTIDQSVGPCGTVPVTPRDVPINPIVVHPATCTSPVTFDVPAQDADVKYALLPDGSRPTVGNGQVLASGSLTITAHVLAADLVANGGSDNPNDYSLTITGGAALHNASCVPPITCTVTGPAYHEGDDNAAVLTPDGYSFVNQGDGKAVDYIIPVHGNLQGINSLSYSDTNVVGNGIFVRLIVDLSADGGSSYNSLSVDNNTITQDSVAAVGSKNVFLGKTIAQIADIYPDAVYTAIGFQTGSAYAAGDGATLTGYSGDCGSASFIPVVPEATHRVTDTNGDVTCQAVGGGSYTETVTDYTSNPVWNTTTQQYNLVETVDADYPVQTLRTIVASLTECPIHATPVNPTITTKCDTQDKVDLATTDDIVYSVSSSSNTGETITATPASATVLDAAKGWTVGDDGTATLSVVYTNVACPVALLTAPYVAASDILADTGSDTVSWLAIALGVLAAGASAITVIAIRRRKISTK